MKTKIVICIFVLMFSAFAGSVFADTPTRLVVFEGVYNPA
jgi:hypothetical protein